MTRTSSDPAIRLTRRSLLGAAGVSLAAGQLAAGTARAQAADAAPAPGSTSPDAFPGMLPGGELDQFVRERAERSEFSGTVMAACQGVPVLHRTYGMANEAEGIRNDAHTRFDLASVTKCITATAVAQLVRRGAIQFTDPLGAFLGGFSREASERVTVHHLLTHSSGFGDYSQSPAYQRGAASRASAEEEWQATMTAIRAADLEHATGDFHYSNSGFFLLGAIIREATGLDYYTYVRDHVLRPAGMTGSAFLTRPELGSDPTAAHAYYTQPSGERADLTASEHQAFIGGPATGLYATATDLVRFAAALRDGSLVDDAYVQLFTTGKLAGTRDEIPVPPCQCVLYGYGFIESIVSHQAVWGHTGSGPGKACNLSVYPETGWTTVVLSNFDTPVKDIVALEQRLLTQSP
jgi:CubicO group peptidase (beta-lactamase class C family)